MLKDTLKLPLKAMIFLPHRVKKLKDYCRSSKPICYGNEQQNQSNTGCNYDNYIKEKFDSTIVVLPLALWRKTIRILHSLIQEIRFFSSCLSLHNSYKIVEVRSVIYTFADFLFCFSLKLFFKQFYDKVKNNAALPCLSAFLTMPKNC